MYVVFMIMFYNYKYLIMIFFYINLIIWKDNYIVIKNEKVNIIG